MAKKTWINCLIFSYGVCFYFKALCCPYIFLCKVSGGTEWSVCDFMSDWLVGDNYTRWRVSQWSLTCYLLTYFLCDISLPLRCTWCLRSFEISMERRIVFPYRRSGETLGPTFKNRAVQQPLFSEWQFVPKLRYGTAILVCVKIPKPTNHIFHLALQLCWLCI